MELGTLPLLVLIALLSIALFASLFSAHKRGKILKKITGALENLAERPLSEGPLAISETGLPTGFFGPLNRFIKTVKEDHGIIVAKNDRLTASNRIFTYNMRKFTHLLDVIPDGILMVDISGNVILANHSMKVFLGVEGDKLIGKPLHEWLDRPNWKCFPLKSDKDSFSEIKIEGPRITQTLRAYLKWVIIDQNRIGKIFFVKEVTDQIRAEESRREFISHVSHELKAPLNSLKSYSEMLMDGEVEGEETRHDFYNTIAEEADRLAQLVDNLMSVTKIEMGSLQIKRVRVKPIEFLKGIMRAGETQAEGKEITIQLDLPEKLSAIQIDKTLMNVALMNLVSNAVKYTDKGGAVRLKVGEDEKTLMFHVIDSGIGISPGDLPHVFEKFYRSSGKAVQKKPGHGLGLALSQEIVKLHGGSIKVTSELGKGSHFTIILEKTEDILL